MYITPNTELYILKNCPLESNYDHTLYFADRQKQTTYFTGLIKYRNVKLSYVRAGEPIRVELLADDLYDCNYMLFKNAAHGDKLFYAFIDSVTYINDHTSEIKYTIDVLQTWYFEYKLLPCYVDREHSEKDEIGENIENENLISTDDLVALSGNHILQAVDKDKYVIVLAATWMYGRTFITPNTPVFIDTTLAASGEENSVSGLSYTFFYFSDIGLRNEKDFSYVIEQANKEGKMDGIFSIFLCPEYCLGKAGSNPLELENQRLPQTNVVTYNVTQIKKGDQLSAGYVPKNAKLYQSPYTVYRAIDTGKGATFDYSPELFNDRNTAQFAFLKKFDTRPSLTLIPKNYNGVNMPNDDYNYQGSFSVTGFPEASVNTDYYAAKMAQEGGVLFSALGSAGAATGALMTGNVIGAVTGLAKDVASATHHANSNHGNNDNTALGLENRIRLLLRTYSLRYQDLVRIDQYFSRFGYKSNRIKIPNGSPNSTVRRKHWNYIKTYDCEVECSLPNDIVKQIKTIYNNGVTFWTHGENVGDYTLENDPV